MSAAKYGHVSVLRFLKDACGLTAADVRANNGQALAWAKYYGRIQAAQFLEEWQAA
jgi:hypothetical protein